MKVYGILFKEHGKIYNFKAEDVSVEKEDVVIVETEKGLQYGKIVNEIDEVKLASGAHELKNIIRVATDDDYNVHLKNLKDADRALKNAREIVEEYGLNMVLMDANFTFDRRQLLFNFTADERVDFRELVKKLAGIYRTRIELRQIGARDKAKEIGGLGQCGRFLCCSLFLNRMDSITMGMAKNQNIALNPNKINGQCGRLLCCLTYEDDLYTECQKNLPSLGSSIQTENGYGKVVSIDILRRKYTVLVDNQKFEIELGDCPKFKKNEE